MGDDKKWNMHSFFKELKEQLNVEEIEEGVSIAEEIKNNINKLQTGIFTFEYKANIDTL